MPNGVAQALPIVVVLLFAYLLLIRPARKRAQEASALQAALSPGDDVMLTSGIFGRVESVIDDDDKVMIEVSPGVVLNVHKGAIGRIVRDVGDVGAAGDGDAVVDGDDDETDRHGGVV